MAACNKGATSSWHDETPGRKHITAHCATAMPRAAPLLGSFVRKHAQVPSLLRLSLPVVKPFVLLRLFLVALRNLARQLSSPSGAWAVGSRSPT